MSLSMPGGAPPPDGNQNHCSKKQKSTTTSEATNGIEEVMADTIVDDYSEKPKSPKSFKAALMKILGDDDLDEPWGDLLHAEMMEEQELKSCDKEPETVVKTKAPCLKVFVSDEEMNECCKPWRNTLIVKVLGTKVSYKMLENKLRRSSLLNGDMRITDLADGFFHIQLSDIEDYRHALYEGPWKVADHYLIVQRWRPFFSLTSSITKKVAVWIRIPKLPLELCNERILSRIGNTLGTMLRVDRMTSLHQRGKFARICVELDLEETLSSHIEIRGMKIPLEYEGLHSICFRCGKYGHKKDSCREFLGAEQGEKTVVDKVDDTVMNQETIVNAGASNINLHEPFSGNLRMNVF